MTQSNRFDDARTTAIMNSRLELTAAMDGEVVTNLQITGAADGSAGNFISAADSAKMFPERAQHFDHWIFNVNAKSALAVAAPEIDAILQRARRLEAAAATLTGDQQQTALDNADKLYREYLNRTQITANVIAPLSRKPAFYSGCPVQGTVQVVESSRGIVSIQLRSIKARPGVKAQKSAASAASVVEIPEGFTVDISTGELIPV